MRLEPKILRQDFPILQQQFKGNRLVYLDNAATTQKPKIVIDTLQQYYAEDNANIHRGVHYLSERATEKYEQARKKVQQFIGAQEAQEIIFVRGTTEAINLVAQTFGRKNIKSGDEIILSTLEHHSNIVPWQILAQSLGAHLRVLPITDDGELALEQLPKLINSKTRLLTIGHVSNALGTVNPVHEIIKTAHAHGVPVLIDGAQSIPHLKINVQTLDCDFFAFSGHKLFGPTGIGVLYGKKSFLETMPPYQGGGDMIREVTFEKTTYNTLPYKFEAGTPNIAGTIGLGAALDYLNSLDWNAVQIYEKELLAYATHALQEVPGLKIIGQAKEKVGVISFILKDIHPHDIGTILDQSGIAIRTGHHCTMPLMLRLGLPATARASFAFYNTREEVDQLVKGIYRVKKLFE
ncbi:MAG: cysteine desulfurase [Deltaproteobacteria bacterium]|nr:cysteine desulfurase [Deltaproteobacteria bacterium]